MPQLAMRGNSRNAARMKAPPHPFPELQGPFEESMSELERPEETEVPSDAASRRTILLDAPTYQRVIAGRWKQRHGEQYHPLWKIVAQLSFGIHLLAENMAKSEEEVMQILQGHIDEIDLFLERTTEDFALAQEDIQERMRCLQLPLQHPKVFDRMLEDRAFRTSIVDGNEKIEHIVARTSFAMRDSLKDAQKGLDATHSLQQYLANLQHTWRRRSAEHEAIFDAMLENVEGWRDAFVDLHTQGAKLGQMLKQLTDVINQMQQRAGEISRKLILAQQQLGENPASSKHITYIARQSTSTNGGSRSGTPDQAPRKPLPGVPDRSSARQMSSLGQRCDTAQSTRSAATHRSGELYGSRTSSRTDTYVSARDSARDSAQARLGSRSPRLVEIRKASPNSQDRSSTGTSQKEPLRTSRSTLQPVELPAALPQAPVRVSPVPPFDNSIAGLGITHHERPVQPVHSLLDTSSPSVVPSTSLNLPLTPSSINSNGEAQSKVAQEPLSAPSTVSAQPQALTGTVTDTVLGSPPSTPGWAKQTFDLSERNRAVMSKTAFRSHPPNADLGSPPILTTNKFNAQAQHARVNGSVASSIGAPGPEVDANASANSSPVKGTAQGFNDPSLKNLPVLRPERNVGKKAFIAELEGTTPLALKPAPPPTDEEIRQKKRENTRELNHFAVELEAPQMMLPVQPIPQPRSRTEPSVTTIDESNEESSELPDESKSVSASVLSQTQTSALENRVAAAVRRSFIATNIELPGVPISNLYSKQVATSLEKSSQVSVQIHLQSSNEKTHNRKASNRDVAAKSDEGHQRKRSGRSEDIFAQLDKLNATSPNLSLKGEDTMLAILPAKTYVAPSRQAIASSPAVQRIPQSITSPGSYAGVTSPNRSRPEMAGRKSSDSSASSQTQWRAFFKGQLPPSEINTGTPPLPPKGPSAHKTIIGLQRRAQDSSPTLGWQWAPETPDMEATARVGH